MTFNELRTLRAEHLKAQRDLTLYPYQELISDKILIALLNNLAVKSATDVENLVLYELAIEISRQAGKTEAIVNTAEFILLYLSKLYSMPIHIGIFAPQIEQARTDFERLRSYLRPIKGMLITDDETRKVVKEKENAKTIVLPDGSSCWIAPVTTTSKPESKTFHLMLFEESQDLDDKIVKEQIWPIGATTNSPRIYIGTAGTRICYYYRLGQSGNTIKLYYNDVVPQRREVYERTGDVKHLIYERTVGQEIAKQGLDSDEIQRPYFGKWLIGEGQFVTQEELEGLVEDREYTNRDHKGLCFAGIDIAKHPDSTVVTILRFNQGTGKKEILKWLELRGENYQNQYEIIIEFLGNYNIEAVAVDATGIGDFMADLFERESEWSEKSGTFYPVKFSAVSKDNMYKNLKVSIKQFLTTLPKLDTKIGVRFKQQMLDLQQEYKGQLLSVAHPDDPNAHDDFPDSWALAEWAFAQWSQSNTADVNVVTVSAEKERHVRKDEKGAVQDYWPGLDLTGE